MERLIREIRTGSKPATGEEAPAENTPALSMFSGLLMTAFAAAYVGRNVADEQTQ